MKTIKSKMKRSKPGYENDLMSEVDLHILECQEQYDPKDPIIDINKLEQLFYLNDSQYARNKIANMFPTIASHNLCALEDSELIKILKKMIRVYNSQLISGQFDCVQYAYPPQRVMRIFCKMVLPPNELIFGNPYHQFIDSMNQKQLKQLFRDLMSELAKLGKQNATNFDYLDMHPFYVNKQAFDQYNHRPKFSEFTEIIREKDYALWVLLTQYQYQKIQQSVFYEQKSEKTANRSKFSAQIYFNSDYKVKELEQDFQKMNLGQNKRSHEEMLETSIVSTDNSDDWENWKLQCRKRKTFKEFQYMTSRSK